jgi:hypothetical protein
LKSFLKTLEEVVKMLRFLIVPALFLAVVLGLGFYLGWLGFSTVNANQETIINMTLDKDKIREDAEKAKEKVHEAGPKMKERIGVGVEKTKSEDAGP